MSEVRFLPGPLMTTPSGIVHSVVVVETINQNLAEAGQDQQIVPNDQVVGSTPTSETSELGPN